MQKWIWVIAASVLLILAVLIAIPPGVKWYLEEHDQELIGRELLLEDVDLNIFNGHVGLHGITLYETNAADTFFYAQYLAGRVAWTKLVSGHLHVREFTLEAPFVRILQRGSSFNFDDLIRLALGGSETTDSARSSATLSWQIDTVSVGQGTIIYVDHLIGSQLVIDSFKVAIPALSDKHTQIPIQASFRSGEGTWANELLIDLQQASYALRSEIADWSLEPFTPYVTPHIGLSDFGSRLGAHFSLAGSYAQSDSIALKGTFRLQDFRMMNLENDSLLAWNELSVTIDSANTASQHYNFGNIKLDKPYLLFELTSEGDNFTRALKQSKADSLVQQEMQDSTEFTSPFEYLALYLYELTQAYLSTSYVADTIAVKRGVLEYQDRTLTDPFSMYLSDLSAIATDISETDEFADFDISSTVNQKGDLTGNLQISRSGISNMELDVQIQNLSVDDLNAYTTHYMGHPFLRGNLFFVSNNSIKDYYLESENKLFVGEIEVGDKTNQDAQYRVPMKLAVALLRDTKGNVDLEMPINGDLSDPDYYLGRIILKVIANVLLKAATSPYRLMANLVGGEEKDFKSVNFDVLSYDLVDSQQRKLKYVANLLERKPELKIYLERQPSGERVKQTIALAEAKKDYWFSQGMASQDSSWLMQTSLDATDTSFVRYLQSSLPEVDTITSENLLISCQQLITNSRIDSVEGELWSRRQQAISGFLEQEDLDSLHWEFKFPEQDSARVDTSQVVSYQLKYQLQ